MEHNAAWRRNYMGVPPDRQPVPVDDEEDPDEAATADEFTEVDDEFDPVAYARTLRNRRYQ